MCSPALQAGIRVPAFYDRGLFYVGADNKLRPVSRVAVEALRQFYFDTVLSFEPIVLNVRSRALGACVC
jgi:hypothetical protein